MHAAVRGIVVGLGALQLVAGMVLALGGQAGGFWLVAVGGFLVVVALIERGRYRSEATEHASHPTGPGGGEAVAEPIESRFRRTPEAFIDPTSGRHMRVFVDPTSGERRYVAER